MDLFVSQWLIWFLVGMGLAFLELFMPGLIIIFMALGCWIVARTFTHLALDPYPEGCGRHGCHSHECLDQNENRARDVV